MFSILMKYGIMADDQRYLKFCWSLIIQVLLEIHQRLEPQIGQILIVKINKFWGSRFYQNLQPIYLYLIHLY